MHALSRFPCLRVSWLALALTGLCGVAQGDETVRRVQEELRKRNLYFGDVDGQTTKETEAALRRYQERKGFPATGAANAETLSSLGLGQAGEPSEWPDLPVLRSDGARELSEEARAKLEEMAQRGELAPIAEPPIAEPPPEREPAKGGQSAVPNDPPAATLTESVERFLRDYLAASESNDLMAEMEFYADRVDYFDHGIVNRAFMEKDIGERYYKRWPQRRYRLLSVRVLPPAPGSQEIVVRFQIRFDVKSPSGSATGVTDNTFTIRRDADGAMKLVALRERRVRG